MRDMVMQMSGSNGVLSVPDEHLPGLVALVLIGPVVWIALAGLRALGGPSGRLGRAGAGPTRRACPFAAKVVLFGTLVGALVHAVIVPTHWGDARVTAILFIVDTIGFARRVLVDLHRPAPLALVSVAMLGGTACVYALYILKGWETMDLVGLVTTTIEAAAALVVLSPVGSPASAARQYAVALAALPVALVSLLGTNVIAGVDDIGGPRSGRGGPDRDARPPAPSSGAASTSGMAGMPGMAGPSATQPQRRPLAADHLAGGQHQLARRHVAHGGRDEDGRAELHGATDGGAAAGRGQPGQPDGGGGTEVHQPGGGQGSRLRAGDAERGSGSSTTSTRRSTGPARP